MKKLLIIRFSAMGDVAMTVPVVHSLARQHGDLRVTMLTQKRFAPLFAWMPSNVEVMGVDLAEHGGLAGLERLYGTLKERGFDAAADLHDVLRTKFLRTRLRMGGVRTAVVDKQRKKKEELMGRGQTAAPLVPMVERYADVVRRLGYDVTLDYERAFRPGEENLAPLYNRVGRKRSGDVWVGIAPFAAHDTKVYPPELMRRAAAALEERGYRIFLFGAGKKEGETLARWEQEAPLHRTQSVCNGLGGLHNELLLMSRLDAIVAMDSANMHMAAMMGTPTVSVWGATHPKAGFLPWNQPADRIVQRDDLDCRPCSVYGKTPCRLGDLRCMRGIAPETIVAKVVETVEANRPKRT